MYFASPSLLVTPAAIWGGFNARAAELPELEVNQAFVQRFVAYTRTDSTTLTLNNESVFDCTCRRVNCSREAHDIYNFGQIYAATPDQGPEWGLRTVATFLCPTGGWFQTADALVTASRTSVHEDGHWPKPYAGEHFRGFPAI